MIDINWTNVYTQNDDREKVSVTNNDIIVENGNYHTEHEALNDSRSKYQSGNKSKPIVSSSIHFTPYSLRNDCNILLDCCGQSMFVSLIWLLILMATLCIPAAIVYGGYELFMVGYNRVNEPRTFTDYSYETTCNYLNNTDFRTSDSLDSGYYVWELDDISFCGNTSIDNLFFTTYDDDYDLYDIGQNVTCWTNEECDQVFVDKNRIPVYTKRGLLLHIFFMMLAIVMFIIVIVWYAGLVMININDELNEFTTKYISNKMCDMNNCCNYICGVHKKMYYHDAWISADIEQKIDYFLGFYCRKYEFNLGDDVCQILLQYSDERLTNMAIP